MRNPIKPARGIALVVVMIALATATILGYALVASSSIRTQIGSNDAHAAAAETLAESGIRLGLYYLQNPTLAPSGTLVGGVYNGQQNIVVDSATKDVIEEIRIRAMGGNNYRVTAKGLSGGVRRMQSAEVSVNTSGGNFAIKNALAVAGDFTLPANVSVSGPICVDGTLLTGVGKVLTGAVMALVGPSTATVTAPPTDTASAPKMSELELLKNDPPTYTYNGVKYTAKLMAAGVLPSSARNATTDNPLNVWYATGDVRLATNSNFQGTLILGASSSASTSRLVITGNSTQISPDSKGTLPALIVRDDIYFNGAGTGLTVNGAVYVGGKVTGSSSMLLGVLNPSRLKINGSLMMAVGRTGNSNTIVDSSALQVELNYDKDRVDTVSQFATGTATVSSIKVYNWKTTTQTASQ